MSTNEEILNRKMYGGLLNSTNETDPHLIIQTNTPYIGSTQRPVSSSAFYMSTARVLKEDHCEKRGAPGRHRLFNPQSQKENAWYKLWCHASGYYEHSYLYNNNAVSLCDWLDSAMYK